MVLNNNYDLKDQYCHIIVHYTGWDVIMKWKIHNIEHCHIIIFFVVTRLLSLPDRDIIIYVR